MKGTYFRTKDWKTDTVSQMPYQISDYVLSNNIIHKNLALWARKKEVTYETCLREMNG
jgi:hypothetical protein